RVFGGNAIGKRIRIGIGDKPSWVEVVGVSVTAKYQSVAEPPQPSMYLAYRQNLQPRMTLIAQTVGDPSETAPAVRALIRSLDPTIPILSVQAMDALFHRTAAAQINVLNGVFGSTGIMGFFLALVGLYAVVSHQVANRTRQTRFRKAACLSDSGVALHCVRLFLQASAGLTRRPAVHWPDSIRSYSALFHCR